MSDVAESPAIEPIQVKPKHWLFTSEQAKRLQPLAAASRKIAKAFYQVAEIKDDEAEQADMFRIKRLIRVREQLNRLDKQLGEECDPQKLDRLVSALSRLQEQEGWLSNRAKPGNLKPTSPKPSKRQPQFALEPQDDSP